LRLLKQQAAAGDIILLFGDESEALTHPYLARAWAKRGSDLRVEAPGQAKKRAVIGALDFAAHKLTVSTSATKRSSDFIDFLGRLDAIYGPLYYRKVVSGEPVTNDFIDRIVDAAFRAFAPSAAKRSGIRRSRRGLP